MLYLDLFRALDAHGVNYLLVGGLAMNIHGVPRMTLDIDVVLALDEANLDRFIACAVSQGLEPVVPVPLAALKDPAMRRQWAEEKRMIALGLQNRSARVPLMVDVLIAPPIDLPAALARAKLADLNGVPLRVASIEDMIALKSGTGRAQDESDINHLEQLRDRP
ncbi:MAG: nucleotidyl transferase AbiEii/AbiGii toxin family protein [Azonexus sp.]|jgi:hypothetical protein|nr:nucleotidyl transferase AbiEii/AbiGii toxin family protein [Betaproteobacteria bacterium]MBK8916929.1 nucleotidyl transferase AbiEii/AbiGii toxin family protein [Betaproteobacteria bacterium]MBP6036114.1 nucleotidyl transferase AbiEii/AbiGii toxin family protein [Azonexus sp.]MBP6906637.1 nucleotidyl transferase AbiEii/AbiGii toxin family protein [Azonexus sp.]